MTLYPTEPKAIVIICPYRDAGWKGWAVAIQNPKTTELAQRRFYYKVDAAKLVKDVEDKTFDEIIGIYGWQYFERMK